MSNLIILAGVPGSGKTTWAKALLTDNFHYKYVSSDEIRKRLHGGLKAAHAADANVNVFEIFHREIGESLRHGLDVVADATFLSRASRQEALKIAAKTGAKAHLVVFTNLQQAMDRNSRRDEDERVPPEVQEKMLGKYFDLIHDLNWAEDMLYETVTRIQNFGKF